MMAEISKALVFAALITGLTVEQVDGKTSEVRIPPTTLTEQPAQPDSELGTLRIKTKPEGK